MNSEQIKEDAEKFENRMRGITESTGLKILSALREIVEMLREEKPSGAE